MGPRKQRPDGINPCDRPCFIAPRAKILFHEAAYGFPLGLAHARRQTPIRYDFHIAIRKLNVDEHAVVVLGIPHLQMSEHVERPGTGTQVVDDMERRERRLDGETYLAGVGPFGARDRLLDGIEGALGELEARAPMRRCNMSDETPESHHQLPEAPPPLDVPPPPLKPPPPPPRPPNPPPTPP